MARCQRCGCCLTEEKTKKWEQWRKEHNPSFFIQGLVLADLDQPACQVCLRLEDYSRKHFWEDLSGWIGS